MYKLTKTKVGGGVSSTNWRLKYLNFQNTRLHLAVEIKNIKRDIQIRAHHALGFLVFHSERLHKDASSFTRDEKLEKLRQDSPELESMLEEFCERHDELEKELKPLRKGAVSRLVFLYGLPHRIFGGM